MEAKTCYRIDRLVGGFWVPASLDTFPEYGLAERELECITLYPYDKGPYKVVKVTKEKS